MSSVAASVMRRPFIMRGAIPKVAIISLAPLPPPCTRIFGPLISENSRTNSTKSASLSIIPPPILNIFTPGFITTFTCVQTQRWASTFLKKPSKMLQAKVGAFTFAAESNHLVRCFVEAPDRLCFHHAPPLFHVFDASPCRMAGCSRRVQNGLCLGATILAASAAACWPLGQPLLSWTSIRSTYRQVWALAGISRSNDGRTFRTATYLSLSS